MSSQIDIGIDETKRRAIADGLSRLLADTYTLYLKTHNFHWNVTGPMFQTLHLMFEAHYNELALAVASGLQQLEHLRLADAAAPVVAAEHVGMAADVRLEPVEVEVLEGARALAEEDERARGSTAVRRGHARTSPAAGASLAA